MWLAPLLGDFRDRHPGIDLHVHANEEAPDLLKGDVDIRVVHSVGYFPGLDAKLLMCETVTPVCSPKLLDGRSVETVRDLNGHTLIHDKVVVPEESSLKWSTWCEDSSIALHDETKNLYFGNAVLALKAAADGQGLALGRSALVSSMLRSGEQVQPFRETREATRGYYTGSTKSSADRSRVRAFREWFHEMAGAVSSPQPA